MSIVTPVAATAPAVPIVAAIAVGQAPAPVQAIGIAFAVAGIVLISHASAERIAVRVFWSEWRGADGADPYRPPEWWPFDPPTWRALIRSGPAGAVEAVLVGARYLVSLLDDSPVASALVALFQALVLVTLALMLLVGLYNRPAWAVAPRFREFPGAVDEWKGAEPPPAPRPTTR